MCFFSGIGNQIIPHVDPIKLEICLLEAGKINVQMLNESLKKNTLYPQDRQKQVQYSSLGPSLGHKSILTTNILYMMIGISFVCNAFRIHGIYPRNE